MVPRVGAAVSVGPVASSVGRRRCVVVVVVVVDDAVAVAVAVAQEKQKHFHSRPKHWTHACRRIAALARDTASTASRVNSSRAHCGS